MKLQIMKQSTKYLLLIIAVMLIIIMVQFCSQKGSVVIPNNSNLKLSIATNKAKAEKLKPIIIIKDSIRTKYVTKWKEVRHDSLIPCPEKLAVADTVIYQDSSLIYSLKLLCKIDSNIIAEQSKVISADSITIKGLKKEVKKQKRQKRILAAIAILLGGYSVIK